MLAATGLFSRRYGAYVTDLLSGPFGVASSVATLRQVALRTPSLHLLPDGSRDVGFTEADLAAHSNAHWSADGRTLDLDVLLGDHRGFAALLSSLGADVHVLPPLLGHADSVFTYDPCLSTPWGTVVLRQAKLARQGEAEPLAEELERLGVPVLARLSAPAFADAGDMVWLDGHTLAVGRTYRTNNAAVHQLRSSLEPHGVTLENYDLPHDQGPDWCLHLMSVISPVRENLAVVFERLAPVALLQALTERGISTVSVPEEEWLSLGCNVLAVAPGVAVIGSGNPVTTSRLRAAGVEVHVFEAGQTNQGEGGPTCMTRPYLRR